jgi:Putative DNA-binding domain
MIPKPLNEITWSDIEALKVDEREEDDMLEYKEAFSVDDNGAETLHNDYAALNKNQRKKANASIAKHAVAFLNGRGGDLILGVKELSKENPVIAEFTPIHNIVETRDRLERAMAEFIEPRQTALSIKAVISPENLNVGVLVIRANSSLRAPHRSTISKDCYVRRGRESVPMPMDEVQDVTVMRRRTIDERVTQLERLFDGFEFGIVRRERIAEPHLHTRIAFLPLFNQQIEISDNVRSVLQNAKLPDHMGQLRYFENPFNKLRSGWVSTLRGSAQCYHEKSDNCMKLVSREIRQDGALIFDFAWCLSGRALHESEIIHSVYPDDVRSALASSLWSIRSMVLRFSALRLGIIEVRHCAVGSMHLDFGLRSLPSILDGVTHIPNFEVTATEDIDAAFIQSQRDLYALTETTPPPLWQFSSEL